MASHAAEGERDERSSLRLYLTQAAQTPLLTPEEENTLAAQMHRGNAAQAALLALAHKTLRQHLQERHVRTAIQSLRSWLSPSLLRQAQGCTPLTFRRETGEMKEEALLEAAFTIAGQNIPLRHQQTLDRETREVLETLLGIARFTEDTLLPLAQRFVPRAERKQRAEQEQLVRQGEQARDQLRQANLRLVVSIAQRGKYRWGKLPLLDRIQEGNIGLMKAVDGFDPQTHHARFSSYAVPIIAQAIGRAVKNQDGDVRVPVHVHELAWRFRRALEELQNQAGRAVTAEEGMAHLQLSSCDRETLRLALRSQEVHPLDVTDGAECRREREQRHATDEADVARERVTEFRVRVRGLLEVLTEREAQVITLRLGLDGSEPRTQREIGDLLGITRARAQQIEVEAIAKLQAAAGGGAGERSPAQAVAQDRPRGQLTHSSYAVLFQSLVAPLPGGPHRA